MTHKRTYTLFRETKTKVLNVSASLVLLASSLGGSLPLILAQKAAALGTGTVSPSSHAGWSDAESQTGGAVSFVADSSAPLGKSALELTTDNTTYAKAHYENYFATPLALSSLSNTMSYSTKQNSASFSAGDPAFQLTMEMNGTSGYNTLTYEPYVVNGNAAVTNDVWQNWNVGAGKFYSSHSFTAGNGQTITASQGTYTYTLDELRTDFPDAAVTGVGVNVGSNNPSYNVEADNLVFNSTTYDFQTDPPAAPTGLYFTRTGSTTPITCGSAVNTYAGMTLHWTAPSGDLNQYAITPSYPDGHGQYTYYPAGSATSVWIGDNFGHHSDGTYTYSIKAQNTAQQWSTTATTCTLIYDSTAPVVSVTPLAGSLLSGSNVTFTITVNDANLDTTNHSTWVYIYGNGDGSTGHPDWHSTYGAKVDLSSGTGTFTVNTKNLPDGTYNLDVGKLYDAAGNPSGVGDSYFDNYTIDNTAPSTPSLLSPVNRGYEKTNDFYFTWTAATDANPGVTYEFQSSMNPHATNGVLDTGVWDSLANGQTLTTPTIHSTGAPDGTWYWQVRAIDAAGNKGAWTSVWHVTIDTQTPFGSITSPANGGYISTRQTGNILNVTGTASDNLGLNRVLVQLLTSKHGALQNNTVYLAGTSTNWQSAFNISGLHLSDGQYSVVASFDDNAGNVYKTSYVDFTLDNTKPVTAFTSGTTNPTPNGYYNSDFTVGYNVSDNFKLKSVNVSLRDPNDTTGNQWRATCYANSAETTGDDTGTCTVHLPANLPDGEYYVQIGGQDAAGNWTVNATRTITIDRTAPLHPTNLEVNGQSGTFYAKVGAPFTQTWKDKSKDVVSYNYVSCYVDTMPTSNICPGTSYSNSYNSASKQVNSGDTHHDEIFFWQVQAVDAAGNTSGWSTWSEVVVDSTKPHVSGSTEPSINPSSFTITATDATPGSGIASIAGNVYQYDQSQGKYVLYQGHSSSTANPFTVNLSTLPDGVYYVKYNAHDKAGNTSNTEEFNFSVDHTAPIVSINSYGQTGNVIQPNVTANDANSPLTYSWAANDAASAANVSITGATAMEPLFTVNADGTYHFTLTVTDPAGNASTTAFTFTYTTPPTPPTTPATPAFTATTATNPGTGTGTGTPTPLTDNGNGATAVLGDTTTKPNDVKGDSIDLTNSNSNNKTSSSGNFLGLGWWWLLIVAAILAGLWWLIAARRANEE